MNAGSLAPSRILLVDRDVDGLAALGSALRQRGFHVVLANGPRMARERLSAQHFHAMLVAEDTLRGTDLAVDVLVRGALPPHLVLVENEEAQWEKNEVPRGDVEAITLRIAELVEATRAKSDAPLSSHIATGRLDAGILPLARAHADARSTGVLSVTTADGAGELRFARGELVDAVYLRLDGVKAFLRLAFETEGDWTFTESTPLVMRRITASTAELLESAELTLERIAELRRTLGDLSGAALLVDAPERRDLDERAKAVAARLARPRELDALLDESPEPDEDVLAALVAIDAAGLLTRVSAGGRAAAFESPEQVDLASAYTARARLAGFSGPSRIVFAGSSGRLAMLAHAAERLDDADGSSFPPPGAPIPYAMTTLRVQDDAAIELLALPLDTAYSPLWPLAIAGAAAVVALDEEAGRLLREICDASAVALYEAGARLSPFDPPEPHHVAALVRAALGAETEERTAISP